MPLPGRLLTLHTLTCTRTEDWTGADECRLEISVDGAPLPPLRRDLNDGQTWAIEQTFPFVSAVTVTLMDEDAGFGDSDDNLGSQRIDATIRQNAVVTFTEDGASYTLKYSVASLAPVDPELPDVGVPPVTVPPVPSGIPVPLPVTADFSALVASLAGIQASLGGLTGVAGGATGVLGSLNASLSGIAGSLAALPQAAASLASIASSLQAIETAVGTLAQAGGAVSVPAQTPALP